jgi:hypothetical protein
VLTVIRRSFSIGTGEIALIIAGVASVTKGA